ncbi:hypothetical protein REPUB_Repub02eG0166700 [Reevesia pubescens]
MCQYHLGVEEEEHNREYVVSKISYQQQKQTDKNVDNNPMIEEPDNLTVRTSPRTPITVPPNPPQPWKSMMYDDIDENMNQVSSTLYLWIEPYKIRREPSRRYKVQAKQRNQIWICMLFLEF